VNGRVFLINASFGLYRRLQEERESRKRRFGRNKLVAIWSGLMTLLQDHRTYSLQLELDDHPMSLRTQMVLFGMNPLQLENLGLPEAECAARGLLAVLVLRPMRKFELLAFALRGALQGLGEAENLLSYCASNVDVHWRGASRMKVAIDGESIECTLPLRFEALRDALTVVVPRTPEPRK
jgi:diacylglycerol kinase family enzyme